MPVTSPTPNGRIHRLTVVVDESRSWVDALKAHGGCQDKTWDVWNLAEIYPSQSGSVSIERKLILVNFGRCVENEEVMRWWKSQNLPPASPRACMAIAEKYPTLHRDMGVEYLSIIAPEWRPVSGRCVEVGFSKNARKERAVYPRCLDGAIKQGPDWYEYHWFAFFEATA